MPEEPKPLLDDIVARFAEVSRNSAPGVRAVAAQLADRPEELAFHSVRGLAQALGSDPNSVVRCMMAAGFSGFAQARKQVQDCLRLGYQGYKPRVDALQGLSQSRLMDSLSDAAQRNARKVFADALRQEIETLADALLEARRVHCVGVRMAFALAHLFTYRGAIAHANIMPAPAQPGLILDSLLDSGPDDVVIVISFARYSAETLRAAKVAISKGARVVAMTDRRDSPLALGAWRVLRVPTDGPHVMHSLAGATILIETLLEVMFSRDPEAAHRLETFERNLLDVGAYSEPSGKIRMA